MALARTWILLTALTGLFIAVGAIVGGNQGMVIAFGFALVMNVFAYWNSDRLVLSMYGARPVTEQDAPQLYATVRELTQRAGLPEAQSPIVPVIIGAEEATLAASQLLADEGYLAAAIRPPTVAPGTARLRLTFTALHSDDAIERLADIVRERILN